jgi:Ca2+-binding RTX toxin-like protein
LLKYVFTKFTTSGTLDASNFVINASALDNNDYLIYNKTTGELSYDADANGSAAPTPIALLSANLALTNLDFLII